MRIERPILILDKEQVIANIHKMAAKAKKHNLFFRPHFKTHQSRVIGAWFRDAGVTGITVSSVEMAEYFAKVGWKDITIAFPCNILEIDKINDLAEECDLDILLVNPEVIEHLRSGLKSKLSYFIEVDNGYHRTGVDPKDTAEIDRILSAAEGCEYLSFKGFLTHSGNSYQATEKLELEKIHQDTLDMMRDLKDRYIEKYPELMISIGNTPCCSQLEDFSGIDEIRPGNFVFFDLMQEQLGSCRMNEIAVALACPVVAKNEERLEIAVYGGGIHLSKEYILNDNGDRVFGRIVLFSESGWSEPVPDAVMTTLSQEHGIIKVQRELFEQLNIGDVIGILPVHSCLTADAMGKYMTLDGEIIGHL